MATRRPCKNEILGFQQRAHHSRVFCSLVLQVHDSGCIGAGQTAQVHALITNRAAFGTGNVSLKGFQQVKE